MTNKQNILAQNGYSTLSPLHYISQLVWKIFRFLFFACMVYIIVYPLIYMGSMALRIPEDVYDPSIVWLPRNFTLQNFKTVIVEMEYWELLKNTLIITLGSVVLQVFSCSLIGYGFARFKFKFKNALIVLLFLTILVPQQMISLPIFINFKDFDIMGISTALTGHGMGFSLLNNPISFYAMAFFGQGIRSGLFIFLFMQFYKGMPSELENAALVDGCGPIKSYFKIMFPNAKNMILLVFLFSIVWYWNDYYQASIFLNEYPTVSTKLAGFRATLQLYMISSGGNNSFDAYEIVTMEQAACILTILPLLIFYIFTQKLFTQSIEKTGIVG